MIDLIQWRVCIGIWCCNTKFIKKKSRHVNQYNTQCHPGIQWTKKYYSGNETLGMFIYILKILLRYTRGWLYTLTVCIFLQLILSGDVESNPGPVG